MGIIIPRLYISCNFVPTVCRFDLLMTRRWRLLPEERLPFSQLVQQLQEYWEDEHTYVVENIDNKNFYSP